MNITKELKNKQFWLKFLKWTLGLIIPEIRTWVNKKIAVIKQKLADIDL